MYTATGTGELKILLMIVRIDSPSPPGVSSCSTTRLACAAPACAMPLVTYSAVIGWIVPFRFMCTIVDALGSANEADKKMRTRHKPRIFIQIAPHRPGLCGVNYITKTRIPLLTKEGLEFL